jgi:predicted DNA-binding transcriptional regulator AlpA
MRHEKTTQPTTNTIEPLWDKQTTAKYLGISTKSLDRWIATHRGPRARRMGGRIRYTPADVLAFVENCEALGGGASSERQGADAPPAG